MAVLAASAAVGAQAVRADEKSAPRAEKSTRVIRVHGGGGYLGVSLADLDAADAKGVRVREVVDDSPAAKAGLQDDDVIVSFDGETVRSAAQLSRMVRETPAGRSVALGYTRGGARQDAQVVLGERRMGALMGPGGPWIEGLDKMKIKGLEKLHERLGELELPEPPEPPEPPEVPEAVEPPEPPLPPSAPMLSEDGFSYFFSGRPRLGIEVVELTEQLARHFKVEDGVLVSSVRSGSAAEKAGLRAGDVIVKVDGSAIGTSRELVRRVARSDAKQIVVTVQRDGHPVDVRVTLEPRRTPRGPST
jgi:C-terminal processing protease CtpA/Prc